MNPYLDPRKVGPLAAAVNWYWAYMCVVEATGIWAVGLGVRAELALRHALERRDG
jgi:hypothetical protein